MSQPINLPEPPPAALLLSRLRSTTDAVRAGQYNATTRERLRDNALALALAAGLADEHQTLAELIAARADGDHARVSKLAGELSARVASWGVAASEALWQADRDAARAAERGQR